MLKSNGNLMIFILTIGVFSIINTEMGVIGILPLLAERFGVSIPQAGLLISLFALAVAFSGPVMPLLFSGMERKKVMLLVLGLFLGFRYRFSGPDLEREDLNHVMGSVADTAADLGRQVMDELRSQSGDASGEARRAQREVEELERQAADLERRVEQDLLNGRGGDKK